MKTIKMSIGLEAVYVGASNARPAGVILSLPRWRKTKRIPYDASYRDADEVTRAWLASRRITASTFMESSSGFFYAIPWQQLSKVLGAFGQK